MPQDGHRDGCGVRTQAPGSNPLRLRGVDIIHCISQWQIDIFLQSPYYEMQLNQELCFREADVLLLRGVRVLSHAVRLFSSGWSHIALALRVQGKLCLCHSTPNPAGVTDALAGVSFGGVTVTPLEESLASGVYDRVCVLRKDRPAASHDIMRRLVDVYGLPYEQSATALLTAGCGAGCVTTTDSFSCAELVFLLLGLDGHRAKPADALRLKGYASVGCLDLPAKVFAYLFSASFRNALPSAARDAIVGVLRQEVGLLVDRKAATRRENRGRPQPHPATLP